MPYIAHIGVTAIDDTATPLWRYLGLAKFLSLVVTGKLYFSQMALLGDAYEGTVTSKNYESELETYRRVNEVKPGAHPTPEQMQNFRRTMREYSFVNCWHQNAVESSAMWREYTAADGGVVIESTVERLVRAVDTFAGLAYVGKVTYIDFENGMIGRNSLFLPLLTKRKNFEHEREIRAFLLERGGPAAFGVRDYVRGVRDGIALPIRLDDLAISIRVSPGSPAWFRTSIAGLLAQFGHTTIPVLSSALDAAPLC
jgi:hypothetical protein